MGRYTVTTTLTEKEVKRLNYLRYKKGLSVGGEVTKFIRNVLLAPESGQAKELREALEAANDN